MSTRTVDRVDDWESRPFTGGYRELHDLADREFSGVVETATAELFMLNGTVVGVLRGDIEDFEDAEGNVYEAPFPALPMLALMQERNEEARAKYYTEDTPLSEVDRALSEGGFTGYVELSENVLSGDYYVVYHGGRSMSVAFIGESARLVTGDDAFEQANGEVGIYEVRPADVEVVEIPQPESEPEPEPEPDPESDPVSEPTSPQTASPREAAPTRAETGAAGDTDGNAATEADASTPDPDSEGEARRTDDQDLEDTPAAGDGDGDGDDSADRTTPSQSATGPADDADPAADAGPDPIADDVPDVPEVDEGVSAERGSTRSRTESRSSSTDGPATESGPGRSSAGTGASTNPPRAESNSSTRSPSPPDRPGDARSKTSASPPDTDDLEIRSVPSIDPSRSGTGREPDEQSGDGFGSAVREETTQPSDDPSTGGPESRDGASTTTVTESRSSESATQAGAGDPVSDDGTRRSDTPDQGGADEGATADRPESGSTADRREELRARREEIADLEEELDAVRTEREELADERDQLQERVEDLKSERDALQAEVSNLESEVETLERKLDVDETAATSGDDVLSPQAALDGTDLFVRYESKGKATLESAHDEGTDKSVVNENLTLDYHTQFDAAETEVGDRSFDAFLQESLQYRFVDWVVHHLLYEIRDTGAVASLQELYDALPRIDRAELNGAVAVSYEEDGERHNGEETFDVVLRDRMGDPLVVANLNDSRIAASQAMMSSLITAGTQVCESNETLAAAFLVTRSFFEPEALETASEATGSGLLSRDKRKSFVKLSRKDGFHLCLVEARNDEFYLTVPEL